jgi:DNA-binding NarL/FixJ family response regulator
MVLRRNERISAIGADAQPCSYAGNEWRSDCTCNKANRTVHKIIFFTIHGSPESMAAGRAIGVDAFVPKAAAGTDLIPIVQRVLEIA